MIMESHKARFGAWPQSRPMLMATMLTAVILTALMITPVRAAEADPGKKTVRIGLTAEYGLKNSFSAQAVEMGIRVAMAQINADGGVLGGRPLALEILDDRSVPARAIQNVKDFNKMEDMVAVFGARFSPVLVELIPLVHEIEMLLLNPWASADIITNHDRRPNYCFRLSLKDGLAMPAMLSHARKRGLTKVGLLLPNTAWGRSNASAAEAHVKSDPGTDLVRSRWYNWGDTTLLPLYQDLLSAGAQAVVLVANDREGSILINEMAALPPEQRLPILSHWGVTGGTFFEETRENLLQLDFAVVQTFSFFSADPKDRERFMETAGNLYGIADWAEIQAPVGVGHAYDLTHLLALAIDKAGSAGRPAVRDAMERLGPYDGLVADLQTPFTPEDHDALGPDSVFMARYRADGALVPIKD